MAFGNGPRIVTDGLILALDAADRNSYVSGSASWIDLTGSTITGSLINGPLFNNDGGGTIVFDGVNDYIDLNQSIAFTSSFSLRYVFKSNVTASSTDYFRISQGAALSSQNSFRLEWNNRFLSYNDSASLASYCFLFPLSPAFSLQRSFNDMCLVVNQSGTATMYNNGVACTPTAPVTGSFSVKNIARAQTGYVSSSISSVYFYNRPLSAQEVLQNYNAQKSRFGL